MVVGGHRFSKLVKYVGLAAVAVEAKQGHLVLVAPIQVQQIDPIDLNSFFECFSCGHAPLQCLYWLTIDCDWTMVSARRFGGKRPTPSDVS